MYRLQFQSPHDSHPPFASDADRALIGRSVDCACRLVEPGMDDKHAEIERKPDGYYLRDLRGANTVRVNGQPVSSQRLASGDEIEIGSVRLVFEVLHATVTARRSFDLVQGIVVVAVGLLILGELAVMGWIFSQDRPKKVAEPRKAGRVTNPNPDPVAAPAPTPPTLPDAPEPLPTAPRTGPAPVVVPAVLNKMIRIQKAEAVQEAGKVKLAVQAMAQVGERELPPSSVSMCIHWFTLDAQKQPVAWSKPEWMTIPSWENFTSKKLMLVFPADADRYAGFVLRTYYRGELQDVRAEPAGLLALSPNPKP
jgi:hypothetical protein